MEHMIGSITLWIQDFVLNNNIFLSLFIGSSIVVLESILPFLPLAVFIAINVIAFGPFFGFLLSYFSTIVGCTLSFYLVRHFQKYAGYKKLKKLIHQFEKLSFPSLVLITAIPFTPAFSINIAAGLSNIPYKKYLMVLILSKLSIIYFWGFIGTTLLQSITNVTVIIKITIILFITFILSKMVMKYFDIS